jgi:Phage integrase family
MTILTAEEIKALADAIPRASDRLAIYVAAYCGLRAGELWALQRRDIDLLHNRLHVQRALKDIRGHLEFGDTKTSGSRRTVSLPTFLQAMLTEHMQSMPTSPDALLFLSPGGGGARQAGDGGPVRHSLFVRRVFKPAIIGDKKKEREAPYQPTSTPSASTTSGIPVRPCSSPPERTRSSSRPGSAMPRSQPHSTATATCSPASRRPWQMRSTRRSTAQTLQPRCARSSRSPHAARPSEGIGPRAGYVRGSSSTAVHSTIRTNHVQHWRQPARCLYGRMRQVCTYQISAAAESL